MPDLMVVKRNFLLLVLGLITLAACRQEAKGLKGRSYKIIGRVDNCEGCAVKLQLYDYNKYKITEQTSIQADTVRNGQFNIAGKTTRPGFYEIHIINKATGRPVKAKIYLPTPLVQITADMMGLAPGKLQRFESGLNAREHEGAFGKISVISSSPVQSELTEFLLLQDSLVLAYLNNKTRTFELFQSNYGTGNRKQISAWADSVNQLAYKYSVYKAYAADLFIRRHPLSEVAILAMLENHHERTTNYRFNKYFKTLSPTQKLSYYGQILGRKLTLPDKPAKYKQHWVGSSITYLKGKTPAGQELEVKEIFRKNKLTLVNFWASWHGPSRWQMPDYQQLYELNRDKGFEIIAVSFDLDRSAWTQAIAKEGLAFRHVSELKGERAEEYKRFRIRDIPFNILFDANGTMVAVDLTPQEVARKLKQNL